MNGYCNSMWCSSQYLSKTVSILYRNFQYKYAETYKAGKRMNKGCSQNMVTWSPDHAWEVFALSTLPSCCVCEKSELPAWLRYIPSLSISPVVSLKTKNMK